MSGESQSHRPPLNTRHPGLPRTIIEVPARHQIEPYQQGDLDGLCGVYTAINGLRLALYPHALPNKREAKCLIAAGAEYLDHHNFLSDALSDGIPTGPWRRLVKRLAKLASSDTVEVEVQRMEFTGKPTIDDVFEWIAGSLQQGSPVLAEFSHHLHHYSVIHAIDAAKLYLFDSANLKFVLRTSCGIGTGLHRLPPKALLRLKVRRRR